ncbi:transposase [Candidatus Kaiserbacteria bacterium]|nr:transposase [Candidatus Kaiserbacteria bacterium]USN92073.1 MAG: transposase [Candidatus Nomurabacteria bacterium]
MPRLARVDVANNIYHVINRATGRLQIFSERSDYQLFTDLLLEAKEITDMRVLGYTIMPNHWHLILHPRIDGDLGAFMHRLTNSHTRRVHSRTKTIGHGPLYQGRYKSFMVDKDDYFLTLLKYVERNPVRAKLVKTCEEWQWGSAQLRKRADTKLLSESPVPLPERYFEWINASEREDSLYAIRNSVNKGAPYGRDRWVDAMVKEYSLETTLRSGERPKTKY